MFFTTNYIDLKTPIRHELGFTKKYFTNLALICSDLQTKRQKIREISEPKIWGCHHCHGDSRRLKLGDGKDLNVTR